MTFSTGDFFSIPPLSSILYLHVRWRNHFSTDSKLCSPKKVPCLQSLQSSCISVTNVFTALGHHLRKEEIFAECRPLPRTAVTARGGNECSPTKCTLCPKDLLYFLSSHLCLSFLLSRNDLFFYLV